MKYFQYLIFSLLLILTATAVLNAQPIPRTFGARRFVLDNNDLVPKNSIYLIDRSGSLGIDTSGAFSVNFPSNCSAILDVSSTTKGMLPPRMNTFQELNICGGTPTEGLVLYNLTTHSFDVFNGTGFAQAWTTKGNYGTNPAIDYLGTFDAADLVFRTANIEKTRIFVNGNVAIGTSVASANHVQITESGGQTALNVTSTGTGTGVNITTGNSNNLLVVNGTANASVASVAADPVWDSRINGDQLVTGIQKIGGSIWLDGRSATHQIVTDAPVNIGTKNNNTVSIISNNAQRLSIDGSGNATMTGNSFNSTYPAGYNYTSAGTANGSFIASYTNPNNGNGISIQVNAGTPDHTNHFMEFRNSGGSVVGSIQGQTISELHATPQWIEALRVYNSSITLASLNAAVSAAGVVTGAALAADAADPLCDVACPGSVAAGVAAIAEGAAQTALSAAQAIESGVEKANYISINEGQIGVAFNSGAGDYAEWMPKVDASEKFVSGNIVAVMNGGITKNTYGATQLMVISRMPIVLGNTPQAGKEVNYEKVAFMGQVPVIVMGKVNRGDYILPSGGNNGLGIAVAPDKMTSADYKKVVGVAWSASKDGGVNEINVAVGINSLAVGKEIENQAAEIRSLKASINQTNQILAKLVPGFKDALAPTVAQVVAPDVNTTMYTLKDEEHIIAGTGKTINAKVCSYEFVESEFAKARKSLAERGVDLSTNPFYVQFDTNPAFKESALNMIKDKLNDAFLKQAERKAARAQDAQK